MYRLQTQGTTSLGDLETLGPPEGFLSSYPTTGGGRCFGIKVDWVDRMPPRNNPKRCISKVRQSEKNPPRTQQALPRPPYSPSELCGILSKPRRTQLFLQLPHPNLLSLLNLHQIPHNSSHSRLPLSLTRTSTNRPIHPIIPDHP